MIYVMQQFRWPYRQSADTSRDTTVVCSSVYAIDTTASLNIVTL